MRPGPPQIRTCRFPASGSSGRWVRCASVNRVHTLSLSVAVSLRRCSGSESRTSFPPTVPSPDASFPPWGPSGRFPHFIGTTRRSDCSPPVSPRFVAFAWRYHRAPIRSLPRENGASRLGLGFDPRSPDRSCSGGDDEPSRVPGDRSYTCHVLGPRRDSGGDGHSATEVLPSTKLTVSALACLSISGLNRTAHALPVNASRPTSPLGSRITRFRLGTALGRAGLIACSDPSRGFCSTTSVQLIDLSPRPSFARRTSFRTVRPI